jgi:hypothetical protein
MLLSGTQGLRPLSFEILACTRHVIRSAIISLLGMQITISKLADRSMTLLGAFLEISLVLL